MKHRFFIAGTLAAFMTVSVKAQDEVSFTTSDGIEVFAYWQNNKLKSDKGAPTVLLFHMARASALGELLAC